MKQIQQLLTWACGACLVTLAVAQPATPNAAGQVADTRAPAGLVKRSVGQATLSRGGLAQAAQPGMGVQVGDTLRTGPDGAVGITLTDDTLLTIGANSELVLSDFSFDSTTQDGSMLVSLWRGTAAFVTGLIAKKAPENVKVQTRTVVLGVRGTEFIVDAQQGKP